LVNGEYRSSRGTLQKPRDGEKSGAGKGGEIWWEIDYWRRKEPTRGLGPHKNPPRKTSIKLGNAKKGAFQIGDINIDKEVPRKGEMPVLGVKKKKRAREMVILVLPRAW